MSLAAPAPALRVTAPATWRVPAHWLTFAMVMAGCAAFMFIDLRTAPIVLWDESRDAVNALEMHRRGLSLVTTYGFRPDLWNTKPPLLCWMIWCAMAVLGPSEWAVRLPSMLSAMGTLALVMSFTRRVTGSTRMAALAAALLALSLGFFGEHGARTGDFDAPLCLFTTAYLYVLFFAVHRRRPGVGRLIVAGGLVAAAVMTKSVAGLIPGSGVAVYLLATGRWSRPLRSPAYLAGAVAAVAPVAAFALLREHASPGYLRAVLANDLGGRFGASTEGHFGPPWFYFETTFLIGLFSPGSAGLLAPLGLMGPPGAARQGLLYSLCVACTLLAVLGLSATKLAHYALPALPWLAVACAIAVQRIGRSLRGGARRPSLITPARAQAALALGLCLVAGRAAWHRLGFLPGHEFRPKMLYGELFTGLERQGVTTVDVVEGGVGTLGVTTLGVARDYAPQLYFYTLAAQDRGLAVSRVTSASARRLPAGRLLATCDPAYRPLVLARGRDVSPQTGCVVVRTR